MFRYLKLLAIFLALFPLKGFAQSFHVVLDPGHGGSDTGIEYGKLKEKNLTLALAQAVEKEFQDQDDIVVTLTRQGDDLISFNERRRVASSVKNGVFLSFHFAVSADPHLTGTHIYIQKHSLATTTQKLRPIEQSQDAVLHSSYALAELLVTAFKPQTMVSKLHVSEQLLAPLVGVSIPGVMIEFDYLSSLDASKWLNVEKQRQVAQEMVRAIDQYRFERKNSPHEYETE